MGSLHGRENEYLARCVQWAWHDDATIDLLDPAGQAATRLSEWQTMVFHSADGSTSTAGMIAFLRERYGDRVPPGFEQDVFNAAQELIFDLKAVELRQHKASLPEAFDLPQKS